MTGRPPSLNRAVIVDQWARFTAGFEPVRWTSGTDLGDRQRKRYAGTRERLRDRQRLGFPDASASIPEPIRIGRGIVLGLADRGAD